MTAGLILLRRFEAVHHLGSFSRAAAELGLTHSAVTKSIAVLEESWNARLFDRTTRRVAATEAGQRLSLEVPDLLAQADAVRADVMAGDRQLHIIFRLLRIRPCKTYQKTNGKLLKILKERSCPWTRCRFCR